MCSIPGLPMPRATAPVVITRVNLNPACGLVQLWVSMEDEHKHSYQKIQTPERRFSGPEGKPEDLCLVCISDTWHRARIVSVQNKTCSVFLIDQGKLHDTTKEALAWAPKESFVQPPEIESCILTNVLSVGSSWSEKATEYLLSLPGKKFIGVVEDVVMPDRIILLDIPIVSTHILGLGVLEKIPAEEFKCLVQKNLHLLKEGTSKELCLTREHSLNLDGQLDEHDLSFYPELSTGVYETVEVTEVTEEVKVFCRLLIFSKAVKVMSEQLQHQHKANWNFEQQLPTYGNICAAQGTDGKWHRSLLKQNMDSSDGLVEVFHVDEGKTEFIPSEDIRPLLGKFLKMPVVTYLCYLSEVEEKSRKWTADEVDSLKSVLLGQKVVARFDHHRIPENAYDVTLYTADDTCVNTCFTEKIGCILPSKSVQESNDQNTFHVSLVSSLKEQPVVDSQSEILVNDGLAIETLSSREDPVVIDSTEDEITSDPSMEATSDHLDSLDNNEHPSTGFLSEQQNVCDNALTVGTSVGVKFSHVGSPQKFLSQVMGNEHSFTRFIQELQKYYTSVHPQPLVESVFVASNPDDSMQHRAKIIANTHSPVEDFRLLKYGQVQKIPLQDVRPIDPALSQLNAESMKRRLLTLTNPAPTQPCAVTHSDAPLTEFRKCVDLGVSSETGLNRVVNEVETDEESLPLNSVDIETASHSASKSLSQKCVQPEAHMQVPTLVPSQSSTFSRDNIEVGGKEKVYITSSEAVNHFYCQLDRDSHLYDKVNEDIAKLSGQPLCADQTLRLNSPCLAKGPDNKWHRGQVTEMSPKLKVHFLDFGDTLIMNESDVRPLPPQASVSLTTPALAIPLGLSGIPTNVPQEVNQWFADHAIGEEFSILVVAIGENGKLIVELFEESVNDMIRKKIAQTKPTRISTYSNQTDLQHDSSKLMTKPNEVPTKTTPRKLSGLNTECSPESGQMNSKSVSVCSNVSMCTYTRPNMDQKKIADAYATCIDGPNYFWCQTNTEDLLTVSVHAEMAEIAQQDVSLGTLKPGSPCLALSSSDNQWYRAQVIQTTDHTLKVLFVDYGNESNVDIGNARPLPESLLKAAPQAFLCSLNGFDESTGSWNDEAYDDFYNLLVDKPLQVAVVCSGTNSELAVPQYAVQIECDGTDINALMQKYWRSSLKEHANDAVAQTETSLHDNLLQGSQTQSKATQECVSKENVNTGIYKEPRISRNMAVYASCISEPHFFWCQHTNTEDLNKVTELAQEAGQAQQDTRFPETLGPGSPCLALFSSDNRWYRAQVIQRVEGVFHVVFIDYGNEVEVGINSVRSVPQTLLEIAPLAFLCGLNGFEKSKGSWADEVYDDFYSLLVDKTLGVTVHTMEHNSEASVPQYSVDVECEGVAVNTLMSKYWKELDTKETWMENLKPASENQNKTGTMERVGV
uniref:Tudor domain-containing protein n=1 Tax=Salarias fasciatus TaxID=181472 RepID=A0A672G8R3_SALFA